MFCLGSVFGRNIVVFYFTRQISISLLSSFVIFLTTLSQCKIGISGDATIISIFTSNYNLAPPCLEALQRIDMFKNLMVIEVAPVAGKDREAFSLSYLNQRVQESLANTAPTKRKVDIIELNIPCGKGDTRPLV